MTYDGPNNGEGLHDTQLDVSTIRTRGYSIISPGDALSAGSYGVSINSGDLNAPDTLTVGTSGDEALYDGSTVSLSSATDIGIGGVNTDAQGNEQFRFDVIWIDSNGAVQKTEGTAGTLSELEQQENLRRFERFNQPIPQPGTWPSPIVAVVVVNSADSSVTTSQLRDYRVPADVSTSSLSGPLTGSNTLSDIAGSGLEIASNSLQVLKEIDFDVITYKKAEAEPNYVADAGASYDIDLAVSNQHKLTLTEDVTLSLSNVSDGDSFVLYTEQDSTGGWSVTWPTSTKWPSGNERQPTTDANALDRFSFDQVDGDLVFARAGQDIAEDTS